MFQRLSLTLTKEVGSKDGEREEIMVDLWEQIEIPLPIRYELRGSVKAGIQYLSSCMTEQIL